MTVEDIVAIPLMLGILWAAWQAARLDLVLRRAGGMMPRGFEERAGLLCMALCLLTGLTAVTFGGTWLWLLLYVPVLWLCAYSWHDCRNRRDAILGRVEH